MLSKTSPTRVRGAGGFEQISIPSKGTGTHMCVPAGRHMCRPGQRRMRRWQQQEGPVRRLLAGLLGNLEVAEPLDEARIRAAGADLLERGEIGVELAAVAGAERCAVGQAELGGALLLVEQRNVVDRPRGRLTTCASRL